MRKILAASLILILLFSVCGCNLEIESIAPSPSPAPAAVSIEEAAPAVSAEAMIKEPEPSPAPTPIPLLEPQLTDWDIDASLFEPCEHKGQLVTLDYDTYDYMFGYTDGYGKSMSVYLPYGYDESRQYDVLFLAHIASRNENWWLNAPHLYADPDGGIKVINIPDMLDNMIERGMCAPIIVIALNCYVFEAASWEHNSPRDYAQFPIEFRDDIMPAVKNAFSVCEGREHYGFLGASYGAYVDYLCVMSECFDLVGWHAQTGGGSVYPDFLRERWAACGAQDEELCGFYICEGERDDIAPVMEGIYNMQTGENFSYTIVKGCGHEFREWDIALYNALQIFFR